MSFEEGVKVVEEPGVEGPVAGTPVLVCFPSAGLASTIVGHYLIRSRALPRCASLSSPELAPAAVVIGSLPNPPVRVHGDASIAIVVSEFPAPLPLMSSFASAILQWAHHRKLGLIVVIEGILRRQSEDVPADVPSPAEPPKGEEGPEAAVIGIPATLFAKAILERAGIEVLDSGLVGGIPAALLNAASTANVPLVVLFVTSNKPDTADDGAAAGIFEALSRLLPSLHLDPQPLHDQSKIIEHSLRDGMKMHAAAQPKLKSSSEPSIYG